MTDTAINTRYFPRRYSVVKHAVVFEPDDWPLEDEPRKPRLHAAPLKEREVEGGTSERLPGLIGSVVVFIFLLTILLSMGMLVVPRQELPIHENHMTAQR